MSTGRADVNVTDADEDVPEAEPEVRRRRRFGAATAERFRARIRRNKLLNTTWRVIVALVGALFVLAGVIMLITPGPGWLSIILGFAILASEFYWARHALRRAQRAAQVAKDKALDPRVRRRNQVILVLGSLLAAAAVIVYLSIFGLMLPWHPDFLDKLP